MQILFVNNPKNIIQIHPIQNVLIIHKLRLKNTHSCVFLENYCQVLHPLIQHLYSQQYSARKVTSNLSCLAIVSLLSAGNLSSLKMTTCYSQLPHTQKRTRQNLLFFRRAFALEQQGKYKT